MRSNVYSGVAAYLDDYIVVEPTYDRCVRTQSVLMGLLRQLGFAINYDKVTDPSHRLTFLGLDMDTVNMSIQLPSDKLCDLKALMTAVASSKKVTKKTLQKLTGSLILLARLFTVESFSFGAFTTL